MSGVQRIDKSEEANDLNGRPGMKADALRAAMKRDDRGDAHMASCARIAANVGGTRAWSSFGPVLLTLASTAASIV